ncbi:MAG: hypothetical protein WD396_06485 [Pseudohongiellaceae bacterium]
MDNLNGQCINSNFSVSLWQEETLLGWYRAKDIYPEGVLLHGALDNLCDNNIVTVWIELKKQGKYSFHRRKALVCQQTDATELLWVNQNADLPSLIPFIALPPPGQRHAAAAHNGLTGSVR